MSDRCHVEYTQEENGSTAFSSEANESLSVTIEEPFLAPLTSFESPCCQILADWIYDGSVIYNGLRTYGSDSYEA